jgi:hypothetical protein
LGQTTERTKRDRKDAKEDKSLLLLLFNHEDLIAGRAVTIRDSSHNHGIKSLRMTRIREDKNVIVSHSVMQERERERARDWDRLGFLR